MKKIFTLLAVAAMAITAQAQTWNFSDWEAKDYNKTETIDGLTLSLSADDAKFTIDNNNKTFEDVKYTKRLKFGGKSDPETMNKVISFQTTGASDIKVIFTSSSGSGTGRYLNIAAGEVTNTIAHEEAPTSGVSAVSASYTGTEPTTIYVWVDGGINIYAIYNTVSGSSAIENIAVDANAPVEYFNLQGLRVNNPENGLYIRRQGNKVSKVIL